MTAVLIALTFIFPFLYKYSFVITNQFSQIPIILSFMDPSYLSNDWYVLVNKSFGPRTIFAFYMAQTAKILTLPGTFFLHYILYIFLILFASYRLAFLITKKKFVSLLTAITLLFSATISLGGNILITRDFSAPQLPLALVLTGILFLFEQKFLLSSVFICLASYLHPLVGLETGLIIYFVFLITLLIMRRINQVSADILLKSFFNFSLLPLCLLTIPIAYLYLKELFYEQANVSSHQLIDIIAHMRTPHHYLPSSWPISQYINLTILISISVFIIRKYIKKQNIQFFYFSMILTGLIISLCFFGYIFTEILPVYFMVTAQFYRMTLIVYWIATISIFGVLYKISLIDKSKRYFLFIPLILLNLQFSQINKVWIMSIIIFFFMIIFLHKLPKWCLVILLFCGFSLQHYHDKLNITSYINHLTPEADLAVWVKNNLPSSSVILTPPEFEAFRLISNHAIVADWKSFPFQKKTILEWAKRMCNIGNINTCIFKKITKTDIERGYRTHDFSSLKALYKMYNFDYIISDKNLPFLEKVYEHQYFIYRWPKETIL